MSTQTTTENLDGLLEQLEHLTVAPLRQIRNKADSLITSKETAEKQQALDEIRQLIEEKGLSGDEVRQFIFPPKYIHPHDPSKTWTGKGKKAAWLQAEIDEGKRMQDFVNPAWQGNQAD